MERFAEGDDGAFTELYRALERPLYSCALRWTGNGAQAEDLVQHTFERMVSARGRFVKGSRVMPWALSILRHRNVDMKKRPRVEQLTIDGEADLLQPTHQPDPHSSAETRERAALVQQVLARLPRCQRDAFELVHYDQLSHAEAAEVLDVSVAGIKSRIQRAHEALRQAIDGPRNPDEK